MLLKGKPKPENSHSQSKGYFQKYVLDCLDSGMVVFVKRNIPASDVNSHTVMCQRIAAADKPAELELNCSGRSDIFNGCGDPLR